MILLTARKYIPGLNRITALRQAVSTWSALRWCKYVASWHIICKTTRLLISQCGLNPSLSLHQELLTCTVRTNSMAFNSLAWLSRLCFVNAGICLSHSITLRSVESTPLKIFGRLRLSRGLKYSCGSVYNWSWIKARAEEFTLPGQLQEKKKTVKVWKRKRKSSKWKHCD